MELLRRAGERPPPGDLEGLSFWVRNELLVKIQGLNIGLKPLRAVGPRWRRSCASVQKLRQGNPPWHGCRCVILGNCAARIIIS